MTVRVSVGGPQHDMDFEKLDFFQVPIKGTPERPLPAGDQMVSLKTLGFCRTLNHQNPRMQST